MPTRSIDIPESRTSAASPRRSPRWLKVAGVAALLAAGIVANGSVHRPCPPSQGAALLGANDGSGSLDRSAVSSTKSKDRTLRIGTFNIHGGRNARGQFDLSRTAQGLHSLQVVALNEVYGAYAWQEGDQAALLGRRLGLQWLFAPTTHRWYRDDFGNGLLSALPVEEWRVEPLPCTRGKGFRNTLVASVEFRSHRLHVLVTHLDRIQDRERQFQLVWRQFLNLPQPSVLLGDLNTPADDPLMQQALAEVGVHDVVAEGLSVAGEAIPRRIDWILARGLHGVAAGVVNGASDHPLVWAEVELGD